MVLPTGASFLAWILLLVDPGTWKQHPWFLHSVKLYIPMKKKSWRTNHDTRQPRNMAENCNGDDDDDHGDDGEASLAVNSVKKDVVIQK